MRGFFYYTDGMQSGASSKIVFRQLIGTQKVLHIYSDWNCTTPKFDSWWQNDQSSRVQVYLLHYQAKKQSDCLVKMIYLSNIDSHQTSF